jgi:hypothetical protein
MTTPLLDADVMTILRVVVAARSPRAPALPRRCQRLGCGHKRDRHEGDGCRGVPHAVTACGCTGFVVKAKEEA